MATRLPVSRDARRAPAVTRTTTRDHGSDREGSAGGRRSLVEIAIRGAPSDSSWLRIDRSSSLSVGRIDPELLVESLACALVRLERLGLPARPVQREHQLAVKPLPQGMLSDEALELRDEARVAARARPASILASVAASRSSSSRAISVWANPS